jgi:glycosyltransferase involved in cell wall biosynthesis
MQQAFYLNLIAPFTNFKYVCGTITTANTYKKTVSYYYVEKLAFIISDVIVTNSNAGLIAKRAPKDKSVVIYNGYDYQRQNNIKDIQTIRKELDINTPYIISMASRIAPQKDIDMLVNTARILLNERDDITFLMIGDGPQLEYYQEYIKKNKISNLKFTGYRNDVESIINASTVCVLCSKHAEGVSNSIMESLAAGKPVIATRSGGTSEIIYNGENGYIVEPSDFHMMASKIKDIIDNINLYNHLSKRAKEIINEKFLLSHMVEQYITMYNKLLNQ